MTQKLRRRIKTYKKHHPKKDDACNHGFCERLAPPSMSNLLPRYLMPQFSDLKEMKEFQKKIGIPAKRIILPLYLLRVSQREIRISRSKQIAEAWKKHPSRFTSPLLVSREEDGSHAIIDGHHRLMAAFLLHQEGHFTRDYPICVYCIDAPASILLEKANSLGYNKIPQYF
jgi:hypothetical protein